MKKSEVKRRLDNMVDYYNAYSGACDQIHKNGIFVLGFDGIHVGSNIQFLASAAGEILTLYPRNSENFCYEHSFTYKGVSIYQIDNLEELPEVVWDE